MSQAKFTQGPIEVCAPGDYGDYEGRCIVLIGDDRRIAVVLGTDDEAKANASLYASAPELLSAAKLALDEMCRTAGPRNSFTDAVDLLDAAISKAEGSV